MTNSIRKQFHSSVANTVLNDIQLHRDSYYYFLGKLNPWGQSDVPNGGSADLSNQADRTMRDNIAFFKRINSNDVSLMTYRYNWTSSTVYSQWDNTVDMEGLPFFIMTSNNQVFKCLFNNHGAPSIVMPTQVSYSPMTTADGYIWQYMYTIPTFKNNKFSNTGLMPVQVALTDSFYNTGAVDSIMINDAGMGYTDSLLTYISISASSGAGAILIPKISHTTGSIIGVTVVNGGSGYNVAYPPTLTVHTMAGQTPGTNLYWENNYLGRALLEPVISQGVIKSVAIIDPGQHYPYSTVTSISVMGDGMGMSISPVIYNGNIVDTIIENAGSGYTFANVMVNGDGNSAMLSAMFVESDFVSDQNIVEQSTIDGAIYAANIINSGSGYTGTTTASISGDGVGATATVVVQSGAITKINVHSFGSGYSYANISFHDVNRVGNGFTDATAYVILPPINGHGSDAVSELYGKTLAVVSPIKVNPLVTNFNQDYRQYGLIKKPKNLYTNVPSTIGFDSSTFKVTFNTVANLAVDQTLMFNDAYPYLVVYISGNNVWLQPLHNAQIDPVGNLIRGTYTYTASNLTSRPTINKYSGDLMYVSDELPFIFSESQGLTIKTYVTF